MHIRFNRPLRGDYGRANVGDVKLVSKDVGKSLVRRGLAVEVDGPPEDEEQAADAKAKLGKGRGKAGDADKDPEKTADE